MIGPIVRRRRRRLGLLTRADRLLVAILIIGGSAGLVAQTLSHAEGSTVTIRGASGFEEVVALGGEGRYVVPGPVGETVVVVDGRGVFVESSDCEHQLCVNMGRISSPGELIACVPNGVTIVVNGRREDGPDAFVA